MLKINTETFLSQLMEFEKAELFVTDKTDIINTEIYNNAGAISLTKETASQVSTNDIKNLLAKEKSNRQHQLLKSSIEIDLIYYLWFDKMAGQLRFNFINSNHTRLPFTSNLKSVEIEEEIVEDFLKSSYLNGISINELKDVENDESENDDTTYYVKVYQQTITRDLQQSEKNQ